MDEFDNRIHDAMSDALGAIEKLDIVHDQSHRLSQLDRASLRDQINSATSEIAHKCCLVQKEMDEREARWKKASS